MKHDESVRGEIVGRKATLGAAVRGYSTNNIDGMSAASRRLRAEFLQRHDAGLGC